MPNTSCRVVIADDEPLARERLRMLLAAHPGHAVVGEAEDGASAVSLVAETRPDLLFLDIRMPELTGLEVVDALEAVRGDDPAARLPAVVFVTAYDEYAVRAFRARALDYLLKPVDAERMAETLARVAERETAAAPDPRDFLAALPGARAYPRRFLVRDAKGGLYFVPAADVEWVEAQENYVALHVAGRAHLVRDTMKAFETKLDPELFVRVHRSAIVNLDRIARWSRQATASTSSCCATARGCARVGRTGRGFSSCCGDGLGTNGTTILNDI